MLGARDALDAIGQLPDVEIDIAGAALQFARIDAPDGDWRGGAARTCRELAREAVELSRDALPIDERRRAGGRAGQLITGRTAIAATPRPTMTRPMPT